MTPDLEREKARNQWTIVVAVGVSIMVFFSLAVTRIDILAILGFDVLFGGGAESFKFTSSYTLWRMLANLVVSVISGVFFFFYFKFVLDITRSSEKSTILTIGPSARKKISSGRKEKINARIEKQIGQYGEVVTRLSESIYSLQRRASVIYWTILASLVVGIILIIFAGYLSSFDTTYSNLNLQIQSERQGILSDLARSFSRVTTSEEDTSRKYLLTRLSILDQQSTELLTAMTKQLAERSENKPMWNWPSTFLRVGVIGLLVFLTQILVSLYRYNSRLIAFYGSRRDSLLLSSGNYDATKEYAEILFPANLDFGREPRHPLEEIRNFFGRKPPASEPQQPTTSPNSGNGTRKKGRAQISSASSDTPQSASSAEPLAKPM